MMTNTPPTPAGWYPDTSDLTGNRKRWWDGAQWTDDFDPPIKSHPVARPEATAPATGYSRAERRWYQRKAIVVPIAAVLGLVFLIGISAAVNGGKEELQTATTEGDRTTSKTTQDDNPADPIDERAKVPSLIGMTVADARALLEGEGFVLITDQPDNAIIDSQSVAAGEKADPGSQVSVAAVVPMTLGQENAIGSARSYLSFGGFSRAGLLRQLTSEYGEGYEHADAEFAITYLEQNGQVDWNEEAVQSAQSYLDLMSFSRDGLYQQLTSEYGEAFTHEQAEYALAAVGY